MVHTSVHRSHPLIHLGRAWVKYNLLKRRIRVVTCSKGNVKRLSFGGVCVKLCSLYNPKFLTRDTSIIPCELPTTAVIVFPRPAIVIPA